MWNTENVQVMPEGVEQMGVQKENAADGVFEGQAEAVAEMREAVSGTGMPQTTVDAMVETYRPVEGMTAKEYAVAFAEAEMYGRRGVSETALYKNEQIAKLPADVARAAYGLGVKAAKNTDTGVQKENASAGAGAGVRYSIQQTSDGRSVAVVDEDILSDIDTSVWNKETKEKVKKAAKEALVKFENGIEVSGIQEDKVTAKVNRTSRREYTRSQYSEALRKHDSSTYTDKMRASSVIDDVVTVATNWANDGTTTHKRNDNFVDFVRGETLIQSGRIVYEAEVIVGVTDQGEYVLYDVVDMNPTNDTKTVGVPPTATSGKPFGDILRNSDKNSIPQPAPVVNKKNAEISRPSLRPGRVLRAEGVNVQKFSDAQYATYKAAEIMARALGADIVIHESLGKTADGKVINGYFDPKDGRIHININAMRDGSHIGLYVLSHEVTHTIKEWSPRKYAELETFVMEHLGADAEATIEATLKQMRDAKLISESATEAEAYALAKEEVVAEGMEDVLSDGKVLEALAKQNRTLWQKIKDVVTAAIGKIKAAFGDLNKHSKTAQVLTDTVESLESIEQLFYEGVVDAGEARRSGADGAVTRTNAGKMQVGDDANYSYKELVKNDPLPFVEFSEAVPLADDGKTMDRDFVVGEARKNARSYNNSRNTETATYVYVPSIGKDVLIGKRALDHGLSHGANDTALATMKIGDLLQNSIAVNELDGRTTKKKTTDMSYVLLAVGKNKADSYVVRMVVDKTTDEVTKISTFGLYSVRTKKGELFSPNGDEAVASKSSSPYLLSTISIADLLEKVKDIPIINEIFSKDVARELNVKRSKGDLSPMLRYSVENGDPDIKTAASETVETEDGTETQTAVEQAEKAEAATKKELQAENAKLREDVANLKELLKLQRTVTDGTTFTKASMSRAATRIMKVIGATRGKAQLTEQISQLYAEIATAEQVDMEDIMSRAEEIAEELIDEQPGTRMPGDPEYAEILDYLRSTSFSLTDVQKQEAAYRYGSYESFRRRMMGMLKIKKNAAPLDVIWGELCELYPGIFSTEMNEADMVEAIVQIRHDAVINQTSFAYIEKDAAITNVARAIYDGYWEAAPVHTLADEHRHEVSLLKAKHARVTEEIRASADRRVAAMRESLREQNQRVRDQRDQAIRKERERADARIEGWRENRQATSPWARSVTHLRWCRVQFCTGSRNAKRKADSRRLLFLFSVGDP